MSSSPTLHPSSRRPSGPRDPHRRCRRESPRLDSPRFAASHDSPAAVVGPRLRVTHALRFATAIEYTSTYVCAYVRTHSTMQSGAAWHAQQETRNNPARSVRPFCRTALLPRRYRQEGANGGRGRGGGRGGGSDIIKGYTPRALSLSLSHGTPRKPPQEDCHLLICRLASSRRRVCVRDARRRA